MSSIQTVQPGSTCNVGKGKTRWEVIATERDGSVLHLSKVGGDGYTNKWAEVHEVTNVQDSTLSVTLGQVLAAREQASKASTLLADQTRRHAKPAKLSELLKNTIQLTDSYIELYEEHLENAGRTPEESITE